MSAETGQQPHLPVPERGEPAPDHRPAPRARTRTMIVIGSGALAVFLVLLMVGVIPRVRSHRELDAAARKVQNTPPQVYVIRPESAGAADVSLAATTQAIQDTIVYARTSGYLSKRYVDIGDHVTAGQLLAEIASPEIDQQLRQAQADLQQSQKALDQQKASLELARKTMERYRAADAERAVAKLLVDQSVATYRTTDAAVAAAEAAVESNKANVQRVLELTSFERVLAPFDGIVIQRNVDVGALITAGSPVNNTFVAPSSVTGAANGLFEVAQIDTLRVFVNVPQVYMLNVKVGFPLEVTVRGQQTQAVTGTVTRTASALDPAARTLLTQVDIPNTSHQLFPGTFVYVTLKIGPSGTHWRVPASALIFNAQGTRVALVGQGNKLHFQPVVLGRDLGTSIDIQAGLQGNETIVKQPTVSLQEGELVTPIESRDASGG